MYSAGSVAPHFYTPYNVEPSAPPPPSYDAKTETKNVSSERRTVRILSRRYALTATGYKYLEIGINVGPPSYVEIAIGDHRGQELILSLETWKGLYEQRWTVLNMLRNEAKDNDDDVFYNFVSVGPLVVRVCTMNGVKLARLECLNVRLTMTESTLHRLFDLDECIDVTFERLARLCDTVDAKYTRFTNIAATVRNSKDRSTAVRNSDAFDKRQLMDCELVALLI